MPNKLDHLSLAALSWPIPQILDEAGKLAREKLCILFNLFISNDEKSFRTLYSGANIAMYMVIIYELAK